MTIEPPAIECCPNCGTQLAPTMLACPGCNRLLYADRLAALAQSARAASERGDIPTALAEWREALVLLPRDSKQHQTIATKITELGEQLPFSAIPSPMPKLAAADSGQPATAQPATGQKSPALRVATGAGAVGLMFWKFKALLLGLTKGTTLFSMLLSLGAYWTLWGWKFALGLVLSIYVHEMGHVIALRRYGFKATAPMFIPGLGALIRLQQQIVNPREDAEIGLAGPIYGLGAAAVALGIWFVTEMPIFAAIAGTGAWINLFNLLPVGSLDGGRGFHAMSRLQKLLAAATVGAAWCATDDGLLLVLGVVCLGRSASDRSAQAGSWKTTLTYVLLVVALTAIAAVRKQLGIAD